MHRQASSRKSAGRGAIHPTLEARAWHRWISVILLVPMLLVGMTAIFIAHKKSLELDEIDLSVYVAWLPGYDTTKAGKPEPRVSLATGDGRRWVAGKDGLYRIAGEGAEPVPAFVGTQVRGLAAASWGVIAAARNGVWLEKDGVWERVHKSDAWSANLNPDGGVTVAVKDKGLLTSADGKRWTAESSPALAAASGPATGERVTLGRLTMDLHTGKAFFGKEAEWIWIDLLGSVWIFLGLTGIYLWWRTQTKRRDAARKQWEAAHG